jgi:hypothetical protein
VRALSTSTTLSPRSPDAFQAPFLIGTSLIKKFVRFHGSITLDVVSDSITQRPYDGALQRGGVVNMIVGV